MKDAQRCSDWSITQQSWYKFCLHLQTAIFLFFAGALGGGMNAVGGGGNFIAFPALVFTGVPAILANATNTLVLEVGTTATGGAYPQKLNIPPRILIPLVVTSGVGGLAGAILLIHTTASESVLKCHSAASACSRAQGTLI